MAKGQTPARAASKGGRAGRGARNRAKDRAKGRARGHAKGGDGGRPTFAAIDLGTNNCRMLLACPAPGGFRVVDGFSRIVRLGEGLAASGRLAEPAIKRTIDALGVCAEKIRCRAVVATRSVATEACRRAENGNDLVRRAKRETGITLEPITSDEEAALTLAGCAPLMRTGHPRALLFDIGGGSTELSWIKTPLEGPPEAIDVVSLPFGVVSLAEELGGEQVAPTVFEDVAERVDAALSAFDARHGIAKEIAAGRVHMLGTSGTVTTLGAIHLGLSRYDRSRVDGLEISFADIRTITEDMAGLDFDARFRHPCIGPGRADLMVMGCAILSAICRRWAAGKLTAADRGIREGLLMAMIEAAGAATPDAETP